MDRKADLYQFYILLARLEAKTGKRTLVACNGRMDWPRQGVYFFFEPGEVRENGQLRVVRVGTHAVSRGSSTTLWKRLSQHQGNIGGSRPGGGNHRGSIFRLHVGTALINRGHLDYPTWSHGSSGSPEARTAEYPLEVMVSDHIRSMPFLWLKVEDEPGPDSMRKFIEKNSIALLSNNECYPVDPPSPDWLGHYCSNPAVRASGMWNVDHVTEGYDPAFLETLAVLVDHM